MVGKINHLHQTFISNLPLLFEKMAPSCLKELLVNMQVAYRGGSVSFFLLQRMNTMPKAEMFISILDSVVRA
jgi:hypothetical protein